MCQVLQVHPSFKHLSGKCHEPHFTNKEPESRWVLMKPRFGRAGI